MFIPSWVRAETACSKVKIEILQELTLERIAFDAKLVITNNMPDKALTDLDVDVIIKDAEGNDKGDIFFIRQPTFRNISDVDGSGEVNAGEQAEVHWLIIPSPGAGGESPEGMPYWVGANLRYSIEGHEELVSVNPDMITVRPEAELVLDYFMPFKVMGDNPFTPEVEPPVPFPLAVRVLNDGYGPARALKIDSAQPKITENTQGLLVDFKLLGASVNDSVVEPSLTVNIGDLGSKSIASAYWEMISTLSGEFVEFEVSFTHDADLGGELTSLLKETNAHYFIHRVKVNLPGRDDRLDILADTDRDTEQLPDTIFESEIAGDTGFAEDSLSSVSVISTTSVSGRPTAESPKVDVSVDASGAEGWVYTRLQDPAAGMLELLQVQRADGVNLDENNFWVSEELDDNYKPIFKVHLLDYRANIFDPEKYSLIYEKPVEDNTPPTSRLQFTGPHVGIDPVYITSDTTVIFLSEDNDGGSGVEQMFRKIVNTDDSYVPAYPMHIEETGNVELAYYSTDRAGNQEEFKTAQLYVDNSEPEVTSFTASPTSFSPHAPKGISASRATDFIITVTDEYSDLTGTIEIATGEEYSEENVIRIFEFSLTSGVEAAVNWDGKDNDGVLVASGDYTARLSVTDGLGSEENPHTSLSDVTVAVAEWFDANPLDPNIPGDQMYPDISDTKVVWQDMRNGNWDIFLKDIENGDASSALIVDQDDQIMPSIDVDVVVWQDMRNGNWDIYGYNLSNGTEFAICTDPGNQERPVVFGEWVAWQDDRAENWDIYLYNISSEQTFRVTSHERDQINPALSGDLLAWEDYRHGLGEIYTYDLDTAAESRKTYNTYTQTLPAISGEDLVWTDRRNNQRDIYYSEASGPETRATYGTGDHSRAAVLNGVIVYEDYEGGIENPDLAYYDIESGTGAKLTSVTSKQEEPALGSGKIVWQDDRDGAYQIYWANFEVEPLPIEVTLKPGFNLIAVGDEMVRDYEEKASKLIAEMSGIERVVTQNNLAGIYLETSESMDVDLRKGMGIGVYANEETTLEVAASGEKADYTLVPGTNYIGILTAPSGYRASDLMESIGLSNIQSVRRFNSLTGAWETASVRGETDSEEVVGSDFLILSGDGLIITMKNRVDGWRP